MSDRPKGIAANSDPLKHWDDIQPERERSLDQPTGSAEHRAQLWDAINEYAEACGATPGACIYGNIKRQLAVAEIEALVYPPTANHDHP